jgi:exopolyphosphatase/pppGpp-phosphohydrolase
MLKHEDVRGKEHFLEVTRHAMAIFDLPIHKLPPRYRTVLWAAAMLHDIGTSDKLSQGPASHAWRSADKILNDNIMCNLASALEIATVASLHRREGTEMSGNVGDVYPRILEAPNATQVPKELLTLAAMLRVADGLVRYPDTSITNICLTENKILIEGGGTGFKDSFNQAVKKSPLLTEMLDLFLENKPRLVSYPEKGTEASLGR